MAITNKPCPFCGSIDTDDGLDEEISGVVDYSYFIVCGDCGATGPISPLNIIGARWLWNMRTEQKAEATE